MVPMRGSVAAQCMIASSQPAVTIVSELSSTTSARDSCMPRLAVPVKPRLRSLRNSASCGCARVSSSAKQLGDARVRRRVVDQHERARRAASARARCHAGAHVVRRVVHRDDDVDDVVRRVMRSSDSPATTARCAATAARATSAALCRYAMMRSCAAIARSSRCALRVSASPPGAPRRAPCSRRPAPALAASSSRDAPRHACRS